MTEAINIQISELIKQIEKKQMLLPEMQRDYVWKSTQVTALLDSLYRGYPAGIILRWETTSNMSTRTFAVEQQEKQQYTNHFLLLDGQQRLTSLVSVMEGKEINVKDRKKAINILFNLEHKDNIYETESIETENDEEDIFESIDDTEEIQNDLEDENEKPFVLESNKYKNNPLYVSITELFKLNDAIPFLQKIGKTDLSDPIANKYYTRLKKVLSIKDDTLPVITLNKSLSYDEVTDIFVRVNSLGTKLKGSDLALAIITSKWNGSLDILEEFRKKCKKDINWDLSIGIIVRTLVAIITGQSKFKIVPQLTMEQLKDGWKKTEEYIYFTLSFLKQNFEVENEKLLSSPYFITTLAYYSYIKNKDINDIETKFLKKWFLIANAKGRYSKSSSESMLDQDLLAIKQNNLQQLLNNLSKHFGRLDIIETDLEGKNSGSGFFKTIFTLMHKNKAKDWKTNLVISITHKGKKDKIEFHHIFPRNILKGKYDRQIINDIANLTFIGKVTNGHVSDEYPDRYLPIIVKEKGNGILKDHCIPEDTDLWKMDNFLTFLSARRKLLVKLINDYLKELE